MTNHNTKIEYSWAMSSLVIDRTRFVYGPTDQPTDQICKAIYPLLFEGGHNKLIMNKDYKETIIYYMFTLILGFIESKK